MTALVASEPERGFRIDVSRYPFVEIVIRHVEDELDAYFAELAAVLARPGPHVLLIDCTDSTLFRNEMRRRQLTFNAANCERIRSTVSGVAFVVPSAVLRGALTAAFWVQPFEADHVIVRSRDEGLSACHHWLSSVEPRRSDFPPPRTPR